MIVVIFIQKFTYLLWEYIHSFYEIKHFLLHTTAMVIPYPPENKTVLYRNWKERKPFHIQGYLIFM